MKKLTKQLIIQLVFSQYSYGRPSIDERIERVFDITQGDRVNIDLAERVGVSHLAVSYPQVGFQVGVLSSSQILLCLANYCLIKII